MIFQNRETDMSNHHNTIYNNGECSKKSSCQIMVRYLNNKCVWDGTMSHVTDHARNP